MKTSVEVVRAVRSIRQALLGMGVEIVLVIAFFAAALGTSFLWWVLLNR